MIMSITPRICFKAANLIFTPAACRVLAVALLFSLLSSFVQAEAQAGAQTEPQSALEVAASATANSSTGTAKPDKTPSVLPSTSPAYASGQPGTASHLLNVTLALIFVVAVIFVASWFVRRLGAGGFNHNSQMKIVSALSLGTREKLILLDVAGKQLLLGVTASQISCLHEFSEPVITAPEAQGVNSEFSRKLMAILQQKPLAAKGGPGEDSVKGL